MFFLPSLDNLRAGDDRRSGLQSGRLGSGKLLPHFLTHPGASQAIVHTVTAATLPNVDNRFYLSKWYCTVGNLEKLFIEVELEEVASRHLLNVDRIFGFNYFFLLVLFAVVNFYAKTFEFEKYNQILFKTECGKKSNISF